MAVTTVAASAGVPQGPTAAPDAVNGSDGATVSINVLANDTPGDAPLDPQTLTLLDPTGKPLTSPISYLYYAPEGVYQVDYNSGYPGGGTVSFSTNSDRGSVHTLAYRVSDQNGLSTQSTVTFTVSFGPVASPDTATTSQGVPVTIDPLANDRIRDAPLDPTTVVLLDPTGARVSRLRTPQGAYTVDPVTGMITFTPVPTFVGLAPPVTYMVTDDNGETTQSTITVTATRATVPPTTPSPTGPVSTPDTATTRQGIPVTVHPLANDLPGAAPLVRTTLRLLDPTGRPVTRVVTAQGTYTVRPFLSVVAFAPVRGFVGVTPAMPYAVSDRNGLSSGSTITVTVTPLLIARRYPVPGGHRRP